jgi:hypothetical protein
MEKIMKNAKQEAGEAASVIPSTLEIAPEIQLREELGRAAAECAYYKNRVLVLAQLNATMTTKIDEFEARLTAAGGKAN